MAEHLELIGESATNPCCSVWKDGFLKFQQKIKKAEEARAALKRAVEIYRQQFDKAQDESLKIKKAYEEEKLQTDHERKEKERESAARISLEKDISTLKTEILSLSQKEISVPEHVNAELIHLRGRVVDSEREINCVREEKRKANETCEILKAEKNRADQELSNLKTQLINLEKEKKQLKKDLQKEKARAESEKNRADEVLKTAKAEQAEAEALKSGKKNMCDLSCPNFEDQNLDVITSLKDRIIEMETEIRLLKEVLDKERKKAETEKNKAIKMQEMFKREQNTADEQRKLVDVERKTSEGFAHQLQKLKSEVDEARSKLVSESSKLKEANKKLEAERKKSVKEKKKAQEQQKIAEMSTKHALEKKHHADSLEQKLEENQKMYDKLKKDLEEELKQKANRVRNDADLEIEKETEHKKAADVYKLEAMKEKSRADKLALQLEDTKKRTKNASKEIQDLVSSKNLIDPMKVTSAELKLLKKRLKLEKARVKHANQVAELEKKCKKAVEEELCQLKLEFARFSNRVGLCNCFTVCNVGKSCMEKNGNVDSKRKIENGKDLMKPNCAATKSFQYFKASLDSPSPSLPLSGTCTEATSGTASKMEPLLGGSNRKNLDNFAIFSSRASFSDRQLVGSQGNCHFSNSKKNSNLQVHISRLSSKADDNAKSPLSVRSEDGNIRKRKRHLNEHEFIEPLLAEGKTSQSKVAKVSSLHGELDHTDKQMRQVPEQQACMANEHNEDVDYNAFKKTSNDDFENFKRILDGDYMKLLNLDSEVEEERYRVAVERPLSPTLLNIDFHQSDDTRPSEVNCSYRGLPNASTCMIPMVNSSDILVNGESGKTNATFVANDPNSVTGISDSRHKATNTLFGNESGCSYNDSFHFIVAFPEIRDTNSLSKISHMTKTLSSKCSADSRNDYMLINLVSALTKNEILSTKEKVCVFFSLFLKIFPTIALTNANHVYDEIFWNSVDICSGQIKKVMSDEETRTMFSEICNLDDLVPLIQNFIVDGRILVWTDVNSETPTLADSKASLHQCVIGAVLLASVCAAFDRIDSICEVSYTVSHITSSPSLTSLHVFAYVCGEKLLAHGDYSLIMTAIKSFVTYCERENPSPGFPPCAKCPFSDGAVSMEELASLLLKKLSECCVQTFGMKTSKSITVPDDTLSNLGDVLSLLELLASKMGWGWVCKNIISQLLQLLEVCVMETPLTAIFVLLGQMGRLGIEAIGFQDAEVENIRVKLSSFISRITSSNISLPVQFAAVNALLGTMPLDFQEISKNSFVLPPSVSFATATTTDCIQKWFSLLSDEHKSLSVKFLTADAS